MSDQTGETEIIGRNERGQFGPGNQCSAGRSSRAAELKLAFSEAVSASDVAEIAKTLVKLAIDGDVQAAKLVLDRCCGKADGGPAVAVQVNNTSQTSNSEPVTVATILARVKARREAERAEQSAQAGDI